MVEPSIVETKIEQRTNDFLAFVEEQVAAPIAEQNATIREITHIDWSEQP